MCRKSIFNHLHFITNLRHNHNELKWLANAVNDYLLFGWHNWCTPAISVLWCVCVTKDKSKATLASHFMHLDVFMLNLLQLSCDMHAVLTLL